MYSARSSTAFRDRRIELIGPPAHRDRQGFLGQRGLEPLLAEIAPGTHDVAHDVDGQGLIRFAGAHTALCLSPRRSRGRDAFLRVPRMPNDNGTLARPGKLRAISGVAAASPQEWTFEASRCRCPPGPGAAPRQHMRRFDRTEVVVASLSDVVIASVSEAIQRGWRRRLLDRRVASLLEAPPNPQPRQNPQPWLPIFRILCYRSAFPEERGSPWNDPPAPRRRLNIPEGRPAAAAPQKRFGGLERGRTELAASNRR